MIDFFVPGEPRGKERPRFGQGRVYTPERTQQTQRDIQIFGTRAMAGKALLSGPLAATVVAHRSIPSHFSAADRIAAVAGRVFPTAKPDADNIAKLALDALNQIVFEDDAQIVQLTVIKAFARTPEGVGLRIRVVPVKVDPEP